jgi:hypothetical protein
MIKRLGKLKKIIYTLVIGVAIVAFWRGAWGLMDLYIFPNNHALSLGITLLVGVIVLILTQNFVKKLI